MDLIGGQELLETLSGSGSRQSCSSRMPPEVYHRISERLSRQAHGDHLPIRPPVHRPLRRTTASAFQRYDPKFKSKSLSLQNSHTPSILKCMTVHCKQIRLNNNEAETTTTIPTTSSSAAAYNKGLLSAVLEGHSDSNTSATRSQILSLGSGLLSISTKDTKSIQIEQGECLTQPSEPVSNDGRDNAEGNLILYENDTIYIPKGSVKRTSTTLKEAQSSVEFRVISLLGQGTFAQVFQCLEVRTNRICAVKIVKNKPAFTRQATVEIDIFKALAEEKTVANEFLVDLDCYFMYRSHLCLVFELLDVNLYEVLKHRQFRGLGLSQIRCILKESIEALKVLAQKNIVHCDLKPENILLVSKEATNELVSGGDHGSVDGSTDMSQQNPKSIDMGDSKSGAEGSGASSTKTVPTGTKRDKSRRFVKLIDFGSACFEGYTAHTYIQSRFYRSPEVLLGLPYDAAIDVWSLGCVVAELFLGLPILPGAHEHDQLSRIGEMIGELPDWMLEQGNKSHRYFVKYLPKHQPDAAAVRISPEGYTPSPTAPPLPKWRLKSQNEYIKSLSPNEIMKRGGLEKLQKPPGNQYFKKKSLHDNLFYHGKKLPEGEKDTLSAFVHLVQGMLDPDPWKRLTALQIARHPFLTGDCSQFQKKTPDMKINLKEANLANIIFSIYWEPPFDNSLYKRKLLHAQKLRKKQQEAMRRTTPSPRSRNFDMLNRKSFQNHDSSMMSITSSASFGDDSSTGTSPLLVSGTGLLSSSQPLAHSNHPQRGGRIMESIPGSFEESYGASGFDSRSVGSYDQSLGRNANFSFALQRPGVFPSAMDASVTSQLSSPLRQNTAFPQQISLDTPQQSQSAATRGNGRHFPHGQPDSRNRDGPRSALSGVMNESQKTMPPPTGPMFNHSGENYRTPSVASGANNESQRQRYQQNQPQDPNAQQMAFMQQQLMQQQLMMMQTAANGQGAAGHQPQMPMMIPQQTAQGGYIYMTMGPDGQPMYLQPVFMNPMMQQQMPQGNFDQTAMNGFQNQQQFPQMAQGNPYLYQNQQQYMGQPQLNQQYANRVDQSQQGAQYNHRRTPSRGTTRRPSNMSM